MIETLLVGFGRFGKEHLSAWEATGRAQISAIVDPTLTIAVSSPDCQRSIPVFASIAQFPANIHFDAAAIVTPFSTHKEIAKALIRRGIPCLIEKPFASTISDCEEILSEAERLKVFCMPGHILRFSETHYGIRARMEESGFPRSRLTLRRDRSEALLSLHPGVHPALLTGIHDIDLAVWFTNSKAVLVSAKHSVVNGVCVNFEAEIQHANESRSTISGAYSLPKQKLNSVSDEITIINSENLVVAKFVDHSLGDDAEPKVNQNLVNEIDHFLDVILGFTDNLRVALADAVHGVAVVETIIKSAMLEGQSLDVPKSEFTLN